MAYYVAEAVHNERGAWEGPHTPGDQGKGANEEVRITAHYTSWTSAYRHPQKKIANKIANYAIQIANNPQVGYSMTSDRTTLWTEYLKTHSFKNLLNACATDCSAMASACVCAALGWNHNPHLTSRDNWDGTFGLTRVSDGNDATILQRGDILVRAGHHVAVFIGTSKQEGGFYLINFTSERSQTTKAKKDYYLPKIYSKEKEFFQLNGTFTRWHGLDSVLMKIDIKEDRVLEGTIDFLSRPVGSVNTRNLNANDAIIASALARKGFKRAQVAGIMGNMYQESTMNAAAVERPYGYGHGLCQWSFSRWTQLANYASAMGKPWQDIQLQIDFLWMEVCPSAVSRYTNLQWAASDFTTFMDMTDPAKAASFWSLKFERASAAASNDSRRIAKAREYYNLMA